MDLMAPDMAPHRRTALMAHRLRAMVRRQAKAARRHLAARNPVHLPAITVRLQQAGTPWRVRRPGRTGRIGASDIRTNAQSSSR